MTRSEYDKARTCSRHNIVALQNDNICGCYFCLRIFLVHEIEEHCDEGQTAICPHCYVDAVIGEGSGYEMTNEFLRLVHCYAFTDIMGGE